MGKGDFMTPKAIANRIKAKGLQKLRWYCQLCEKSCRDENGFKNHCSSEAHLRQMAIYRESPDSFMKKFSKEFENGFLSILQIRGQSRVLANSVYQEYIKERHHIHMKATHWESLASFVQYLGKTGKAEVDNTPKGWYIRYIDRDPESVRKQEAALKKERMMLDEVQRNEKRIKQQMEAAATKGDGSSEKDKSREFKRDTESQKITFNMSVSDTSIRSSSSNLFSSSGSSSSSSRKEDPTKKKRSAVHDLMEDISRSRKQVRKDYWIVPNLIVKIMNKKLVNGDFYKKKAKILEVIEKYTARVKLLDSDVVIRIDQAELETVIPGLDRYVMIVNGRYRGERAVLVSLEPKNFSATLRLSSGVKRGEIVSGIDYENFCKLAT